MATTIKIGHASSPSIGLVIKEDYPVITNLEPDILLRFKDRAKAEKAAEICEAACKNDLIVYTQSTGAQPTRNSFVNQALKVDNDPSKITVSCGTDCSGLVSGCAYLAGANISSYPYNCGSIKKGFKDSDDFDIYEEDKYLKSTDYLQRGDILVRTWYKGESRHALMVLENGSKAAAFTSSIGILSALDTVGIDYVKISTILKKIEGYEEASLNDLDTINTYKWSYSIVSLTDNSKDTKKNILVSSANFSFTVDALNANTTYLLRIHAKSKESEIEFFSKNIIFTTLKALQPEIIDIALDYNKSDILNGRCKLVFSGLRLDLATGYRVSLLANNKVIYSNDNLIAGNNNYFYLNELVSLGKEINFFDSIQVGIQINSKQNQDFDNIPMYCSKALFLTPVGNLVNKIFVKILENYKHAVIKLK